jgi:hypothetical protein
MSQPSEPIGDKNRIMTQALKRTVFADLGKDKDRLCGLVVRVLGYRSGDPGSIPGTTRKKK